MPLVGPTGEWFDDELADAGLPRARLYLINAIACLPPPGAGENDMRRAAQACAPLFKAQLACVPAKTPTLLMGKWAAFAVTGKDKGVLKVRGFINYEQNQIITWHPTYAGFHNPFEWGAFTADLRRFARLIRGQLRPRPRALLTDPSRADVARLVGEGLPIALDIETRPANPIESWTGKDPTRALIKTVGLGNINWALSRWWKGDRSTVERAIKRVIEDENVLKVTQNGWWFDIPILRRHGINPR